MKPDLNPEEAKLIIDELADWIPEGASELTAFWNETNARVVISRLFGRNGHSRYTILRGFMISPTKAVVSVDYDGINDQQLAELLVTKSCYRKLPEGGEAQ